MIDTPASTTLHLARAEALGKALTARGWTAHRETSKKHPGTIEATIYTRRSIKILILTLRGRASQMVEITVPNTGNYPENGRRRVRKVSQSWRMTTYDAPIEAILGATAAVLGEASQTSQTELARWTIDHAPHCEMGSNTDPDPAETSAWPGRKVRATRFTRHDGAVTATFHLPTYTPPCEGCDHDGDLGDAGGWLITGPGFTAEATAHTPQAVIAAFAHALPGHRLSRQATSVLGTRQTSAVR